MGINHSEFSDFSTQCFTVHSTVEAYTQRQPKILGLLCDPCGPEVELLCWGLSPPELIWDSLHPELNLKLPDQELPGYICLSKLTCSELDWGSCNKDTHMQWTFVFSRRRLTWQFVVFRLRLSWSVVISRLRLCWSSVGSRLRICWWSVVGSILFWTAAHLLLFLVSFLFHLVPMKSTCVKKLINFHGNIHQTCSLK